MSDGIVTITWNDPPPANQPPDSVSDLQINDKPETDAMATKAVNWVDISALLQDPEKQACHLLVWLSSNSAFPAHRTFTSPAVASGKRATLRVTDLLQNTRYYGRAWAVDSQGLRSTHFNTFNFWTNRNPTAPKLTAPGDNVQFLSSLSMTFAWDHVDPDPDDPQAGFQYRYRVSAGPSYPAGPWHLLSFPDRAEEQWVSDPLFFKSSTFYDWTVRTKDVHNRWSPWADPRSFFAIGTTAPPLLVDPTGDIAVDVAKTVVFLWRFRTPLAGKSQSRADIRWRAVGADDSAWITTLGQVDPDPPGHFGRWAFDPDTLAPQINYEWQIRTYDSASSPVSDWSESGTFWSLLTPGGGVPEPPEDDPDAVLGTLGCGSYRVFAYARGGTQMLGELTPVTGLTFFRVRDDISHANLKVTGFGADCGDLMKRIRCWMHEIVIFRDGQRVWEGPITRITYTADGCEFEAQDVMVYLYRRVMRQGFNDAYRIIDGVEIGLPTVVERAMRIAMNALAPFDPNVLPYLTALMFDDDARESRVVPDYSQTAWEQIDDLAATAGLDYTTVGRRIMLWDTHRSIGRLPLMTDGDFSEPPVVSEYGMQLCNYSAVTNGSGLWSAVRPFGEDEPNEFYGMVELLASAYGEAQGAADTTLTQAAKERLLQAMKEQARRNVANRWPTPLIVRVPDNSTLSPDINLTFDQLVPGVWIPVHSRGTLREVGQWQKLDRVTVAIDPDKGEQISVIMSPAPNGGQDPDQAGSGGDEGVNPDGETVSDEDVWFSGGSGLSPWRTIVPGEGP